MVYKQASRICNLLTSKCTLIVFVLFFNIFQKFVDGLDLIQMKKVITSLLSRFPEVYMDAYALTQPEPPPVEPEIAAPWCVCTKCMPMPTEVENKCCRIRTCITSTQNFVDAVINGNVLIAAMEASRDKFSRNIQRHNESYRQFIYIQHGRLGAANRHVVPACVVLRVRRGYPSPNNMYKGCINGVRD